MLQFATIKREIKQQIWKKWVKKPEKIIEALAVFWQCLANKINTQGKKLRVLQSNLFYEWKTVKSKLYGFNRTSSHGKIIVWNFSLVRTSSTFSHFLCIKVKQKENASTKKCKQKENQREKARENERKFKQKQGYISHPNGLPQIGIFRLRAWWKIKTCGYWKSEFKFRDERTKSNYFLTFLD